MEFNPKLTFDELIRVQNEARRNDSSKIKEKRIVIRNMLAAEQEILFERTRGIVQDLIQLRPFLTNVDQQKFAELEKRRFYDPNFIAVLQYYFDVLVIPNPDTRLTQTPSAQLFRDWLTNLKPLASGVDGSTFTSNFGKLNDVFVIKAPNKLFSRYSIHEQFVAMVYTNRLRELCPNFATIYGSFMCSPPLVDKQYAEVQGFCYHNILRYSSNHLVYENVGPLSLANWFRLHLREQTLTPAMLINSILQVSLSLELANSQPFPELQGFQHGDSHLENLVVRELDTVSSIYWTHRQRYLNIKRIISWIDYSRAHIRWSDKDYYFPEFNRDGVGEILFPLADVFRVIIDIMNLVFYYAAKYQNIFYYNPLKQLLLPLYYFFFQYQEKFPVLYGKLSTREIKDQLPYNPEWTKYKISDIVQFILQQPMYSSILNKQWVDKSELPLLSCATDRDKCPTVNDYIHHLNSNRQQWPAPQTIFELADQAKIGRQFNPNYNYPPWNYEWIRTAYNQLIQTKTKLNNVPFYIFYVSKETYLTKISMQSFLSYEQNILRYTRLWLEMRKLLVVPLLVMYYFYPSQLETMNSYYNNLQLFMNENQARIAQILNSIQVNLVTISNELHPPADNTQAKLYRRGIDILSVTVLPVLTEQIIFPELNNIERMLNP